MKKNFYDVIIVGTGVAGCFTALHLPKEKKVLMITKGELEESNSCLAQGGICVQKDEEDYQSFFEDTMRAGHYENDPRSVDIMIRSSREVIDELISFGVEFEKKDGEFLYTKEGAHSTNRILYHEDLTGKEITTKLLAQVKQLEQVDLLEHTAMMDILSVNNSCEGILIKDKEGNLQPIFAKDVVWACGGIGGLYENSTNRPGLTGDALAIALKHKIQLKNIHYVQIHPTTLYDNHQGRRFLISESVRGEGAILHDEEGNRFVDELLPRDVLSDKIRAQMQKTGTRNVWLSFKTIEDMDIQKRFPNIYQKCLEEGYHILEDSIPVVPAQHYFMGGVAVDTDSKTSMKHLYAAGETSCNGVHGANRLASNSLLESLVFGKRAALSIGKEAATGEETVSAFVEIKQRYGIDLQDYQDEEQLLEQRKAAIFTEMKREAREAREKGEKEKQNESNYQQVKCG